eukprot:UN08769
MALTTANSKQYKLYLDENVKIMAELPGTLVRLSDSYIDLNKKFEDKLNMAHDSFKAFENETKKSNKKSPQWTATDDLCFKNLEEMRKNEEDMVMFQDEKISLIQENLKSMESYITKISKDLDEFQKLLQPNMIKLPFPNLIKKF